ncbi:MAG: tRNA (N6-threonylcarbamoyladenosine(37)-N6)-methyltransferase TrmO [Eubacteriales bacterium]|nr:tRNA (N6-threonylcarbamoyladenosine(37)-N6)-methyltransferase TrmO [Eubacteriales bacterium]MDD3880710.1 tRNA (N6-threonylcarbamoyladenosine(37)-N6)-methyltransferase TrmO [Eubacteriales bacterium]MDD4511656.1 tRNA (N6-threonylcarbamoyladenosine(37)-N6)-methyltransferase TrmO [Eubacteriales bacterium]
MSGELTLAPIARLYSDLPTKFGVPRQSGLAPALESLIVFEKEFSDRNALRGIMEYSHLWLIWGFSENEKRDGFSATVRPPRLGGNTRIGVFATRSPFRPNPLGLSSVRLIAAEEVKDGLALRVSGADLVSGTPIYDIKPYLPYSDSHPDAKGGFGQEHSADRLTVFCEKALCDRLPEKSRRALIDILASDPRPSYQNDSERVYGFPYAGFEIRFRVNGSELTVTEIEEAGETARQQG